MVLRRVIMSAGGGLMVVELGVVVCGRDDGRQWKRKLGSSIYKIGFFV